MKTKHFIIISTFLIISLLTLPSLFATELSSKTYTDIDSYRNGFKIPSNLLNIKGINGNTVSCPNGACVFPITIENNFDSPITIYQTNIKADGNKKIKSSYTSKEKTQTIQENYTTQTGKEYVCKDKITQSTTAKGNITYSCPDAPQALIDSKSVSYSPDNKTFYYIEEQEATRTIEKVIADTSNLVIPSKGEAETRVYFQVPLGSSGKFDVVIYLTINEMEYTFVLDPYWTSSGYVWRADITNSTAGIISMINGSGTYAGSDINGSGITEWFYFINSVTSPAIFYNNSWTMTIGNATETAWWAQTTPNSSQGGNSAPSGLVGYYPLDEESGNAIDYSGNEHNGTRWRATPNQTGKINKGSLFNAEASDINNNRYTIADSADFDFDGELTFCAWAKPTYADWNGALLYRSPAGFSSISFFLGQGTEDDGKWYIRLHPTAGLCAAVNSDSAPSTTEFSHVCGTRLANDTVYLYIDGVRQVTTTQTCAGTIAPTSATYIGDIPGSYSYNFVGIIDDVQIWNTSFTDAEFEAIYKQGAYLLAAEKNGTDLTLTINSATNTTLLSGPHIFNLTTSLATNCTMHLDSTNYSESATPLKYNHTWNISLIENNYTVSFSCTNETTVNSSEYWLDILDPVCETSEGYWLYFCVANYTNSTWTDWRTNGTCLTNDSFQEIRNFTEYDVNSCPDSTSTIYYESRYSTCDYCTPYLVNTTWSSWTNITECYSNETANYQRNLTEFDNNTCYEVTSLPADYIENTTYDDYKWDSCSYDEIPPSITINSVQDQSIPTYHIFNISVDESSTCILYRNETAYENATPATNFVWNQTSLLGNYSIEYLCTDLYNNSAWSTDYWLYADGYGPAITLSWSDANSTITTNSTNITINLDESSNCTLDFNGTTATHTIGLIASWEINDLALGNYSNISISCIDTFNNTASIENMWINVEEYVPIISPVCKEGSYKWVCEVGVGLGYFFEYAGTSLGYLLIYIAIATGITILFYSIIQNINSDVDDKGGKKI